MKTFLSISTLIITTIFLFASCAKEKCKNCPSLPDSSLLCVSFSGDYSLQTQTKASSTAFPSGIQTSIHAYSAGDNPTIKAAYPGTPISATSDASGNLVFNSGVNLFMPGGSYDFYSVSTNSSSVPNITFTNGLSGVLNNGVDYLWASGKNTSVTANTNVPFQFAHRATALRLNITAGDGVTGLTVKSIKIGQTQQGAVMGLSTGVISAASALSADKADMMLDSNTGTFIMLPLIAGISIPVEVYVDATIGGSAQTNKKYTATIPAPTGGFESGTIYKFAASIGASGITFLNATLEDWNEQTLVSINLNE
ncbi:MAG: fimbrillin family protein [Bacteroidales bacterium]|jgi:hypothetical protein